MPTYVYRREDGTTFEAFQRITDDPLQVDPETGQRVQRVISGGAGLQFKGTGFYLTDYARKGAASSESAGESSGASSSEAKPAAKTEPKGTAPADSSSGSASD